MPHWVASYFWGVDRFRKGQKAWFGIVKEVGRHFLCGIFTKSFPLYDSGVSWQSWEVTGHHRIAKMSENSCNDEQSSGSGRLNVGTWILSRRRCLAKRNKTSFPIPRQVLEKTTTTVSARMPQPWQGHYYCPCWRGCVLWQDFDIIQMFLPLSSDGDNTDNNVATVKLTCRSKQKLFLARMSENALFWLSSA